VGEEADIKRNDDDQEPHPNDRFTTAPRHEESKMLNKTLLIGNLTHNAESRDCPRTTLRLATHRWSYTDGKRREVTDYHRIVLFGRKAVRTANLKTGQKIYIEGRIQTRNWDDAGTTRYITEIVAERIEVLSRASRESS